MAVGIEPGPPTDKPCLLTTTPPWLTAHSTPYYNNDYSQDRVTIDHTYLKSLTLTTLKHHIYLRKTLFLQIALHITQKPIQIMNTKQEIYTLVAQNFD